MGRHDMSDAVSRRAGSRVWAGRALLLATGVGSVMGAGAGMAMAAPDLDDSAVPTVAMTGENRSPVVPSAQEAPALGQTPSVPGLSELPSAGEPPSVPSLDSAPVDGASVVGQLTDRTLRGEGSVSGSEAALSGSAGDDMAAQAGAGEDGGAAALAGPGDSSVPGALG